MRFLVLALVACHASPRPTMTWPALDSQLLADAAATFNFRLGLPTPLAITKDGALLFRRTPPRAFAADLYELAPDGSVKTLATVAELMTGEEHLSNAEKARRERTRTATKGVVDIDVSDDGTTVFVPLGGRFHLIDRKTGTRKAWDPDGEAYDPHLSPDGTKIAFVRAGDLYVTTASGTKRLTKHPGELEYGVADFAAQEELGRRRGFWWSPDSRQLAFQRTDASKVDTIYVADARHNDKPPVPFKYPRAGTPNATLDLGVISVDGGEPKWFTWDRTFEYLVSVSWKGPLTALVIDRDQQNLALIAVESGKTLLTEHDDAWLNVNTGAPRWLDDGSAFLWMTEARGAWTLELYAADGTLQKVLTQPELGLRDLAGVDGGAAYVTASADAPHQDVWKVPLDGSAPTRLTKGDGVASVMVKHGVVVLDESLAAGGKRMTANGHVVPSVAETPLLEPTTQLETVQLGGRDHAIAITRPRHFDPHRAYPVLLKVYAGPHATMVTASRDAYVMDQWYADAGFIVMRADGRGTPNRGRAWERAILEDLITVPLQDQVDALRAAAARHPEMDLARVGVFGWSFGGYFSTMAVLLRPDVFACGVAGAPVTDWALYDTAYTERYMKQPKENPDGYRETSALTHAGKLSKPLLIIHGITDDNVHFAHALALIEALYVEHKRAEVITLSATHMVPDPKLNLAREQVQIDFFRQHLGPP